MASSLWELLSVPAVGAAICDDLPTSALCVLQRTCSACRRAVGESSYWRERVQRETFVLAHVGDADLFAATPAGIELRTRCLRASIVGFVDCHKWFLSGKVSPSYLDGMTVDCIGNSVARVDRATPTCATSSIDAVTAEVWASKHPPQPTKRILFDANPARIHGGLRAFPDAEWVVTERSQREWTHYAYRDRTDVVKEFGLGDTDAETSWPGAPTFMSARTGAGAVASPACNTSIVLARCRHYTSRLRMNGWRDGGEVVPHAGQQVVEATVSTVKSLSLRVPPWCVWTLEWEEGKGLYLVNTAAGDSDPFARVPFDA